MTENPGFDEIMSRFGEASYSPEFWAAVNKRTKEESKAFFDSEAEDARRRHAMLGKRFGPLKGDG